MHRDPRTEKAQAMKVKGMSLVAIADELGVDRTTVGRWLKTK
jgi:putative DNA primase/helicase